MSTPDSSPPVESEVFDLPEFSPRQTRRAIRRGVARTAFTAVAIVVVVLVVLNLFSHAIQNRAGRGNHFTNVVGTGFAVAHPDYRYDNPPICCHTGLTSMSLIISATPRTPNTTSGTTTIDIDQNLLGHVTGQPSLTQTPLIQQLVMLHDDGESTTTAKTRARNLMAALPQRLTTTAVIDFAEPLTQQDFTTFQRRYHLATDGAILLSAAGGQNGPRMLPVGWPGTQLTDYQHWAAGLRNSDRDNLNALFLNLDNLRHAAQHPRIYGYIIDAAALPTLRQALDNPAVHTIRLAQATFDLSTP